LELFAAAAPGLAEILARELTALGLRPDAVSGEGVTFHGGLDAVRRANMELRTASRVLVRLGSFSARTFAEMERRAAKLDWRPYVSAGGTATFRVTARKCRLYHTGAIAERLARTAGVSLHPAAADDSGAQDPAAAVDGGAQHLAAADDGGAQHPAAWDDGGSQRFVVRGVRDEWLVSADSSGEHLHRRGYRLATARAPIRETLAAAALLASGWDRRSPLLDPFCGSGTICIEGALLALDRAPGATREFAFTRWPGYDGPEPTPPMPAQRTEIGTIVQGSDRDAGAVEAARGNAGRAGVAAAIRFARQSLSELDPPASTGWLVTNPPYGVRVGDPGALRDLYARFGGVVRERCPGWTVLFFSAERQLERATGLRLTTVLTTESGGLPIRLLRAQV
jgi:putative N6-adenine-specific DNA methylase